MRIAALISGGVDSSVALARLVDQGHDVTAFYLKIWLEDELSFLGNCPWEDDLKLIEQTCTQLNVPLEVIPLQKDYWENVVAYTLEQARKGLTPNPDIFCNLKVKFDAFFQKIPDSFEKIATGHYAQTAVLSSGTVELICSPDQIKDQTYFLAHLSQEQLSRIIFPLGASTKEEVRAEAVKRNLPSAHRKDSYGICFLGKISFREFLKHHLKTRVGEIREFETNELLGEHEGYWFYTIGQRKGLGLSGGPWFVVTKDIARNIIYISRSYHEKDKERREFLIEPPHWIIEPTQGDTLSVKLRHGPHKEPCSLTKQPDGRYRVTLESDDQGIAPGQFAVFYQDQRCLGCGSISLASISCPE